jgi:ankyrin repeat protein
MDDVKAFCRALWRHEVKTIAALAPCVDPNARDPWGNTPLLMAAQYGDLSLVSLLVRRGGDVDQQRKHLTPITLAARRNAADIVNFLRDNGATVSIVTCVHLGEREGCAQELVRDSRQARLRDEQGTPILHHAVEALQPGWSNSCSSPEPASPTPIPMVRRRCIALPTCAKYRKNPRPGWRRCCSIAEPTRTRATGTT